jgi:hypothetical protein
VKSGEGERQKDIQKNEINQYAKKLKAEIEEEKNKIFKAQKNIEDGSQVWNKNPKVAFVNFPYILD